jgi:hypothetical protein
MGGRNIYISVLVFIAVLFPPSLLSHGDQATVWASEALAFAASLTTLHLLDGRQRRREQGRD